MTTMISNCSYDRMSHKPNKIHRKNPNNNYFLQVLNISKSINSKYSPEIPELKLKMNYTAIIKISYSYYRMCHKPCRKKAPNNNNLQ